MKKFNRIILLLVLLLEVNFFSLLKMPLGIIEINSYYSKELILILIISGLLVNLLSFKFKSDIYINKTDYIPSVFLFIVLLIYVLSSISYSQTLTEVFSVSYFYYIIVMYFLLKISEYRDQDYFHFFWKSIVLIGSVYSMILILQFVFLKFGLPLFLQLHEDTILILSMDSNPRISRPADFIMISTILSIMAYLDKDSIIFKDTGLTLHKTSRYKWLTILIVLQFIYLLVVSQTRMYTLSLVIPFLLIWFITNKNYFIRLLLICLSAIVLLLQFSTLKNFIFSFFVGERTSSTTIRVEESYFFREQIFDNLIFGRGFLRNTNLEAQILNHGPYGFYNVSDIGYLGFLSVFGFLGIVVSAVTLWVVLNLMNKISILRMKRNFIFLYFMIFSITVSSTTLFYTDVQRIFYLPILVYMLLKIEIALKNYKTTFSKEI